MPARWKNQYITDHWFLMKRKDKKGKSFLCHKCDECQNAEYASWDMEAEVWYCDMCDINAPPLVDTVAFLAGVSRGRRGQRGMIVAEELP